MLRGHEPFRFIGSDWQQRYIDIETLANFCKSAKIAAISGKINHLRLLAFLFIRWLQHISAPMGGVRIK
ncbi:hypothetical protein D3C76_1616810 [compost metagenome]